MLSSTSYMAGKEILAYEKHLQLTPYQNKRSFTFQPIQTPSLAAYMSVGFSYFTEATENIVDSNHAQQRYFQKTNCFSFFSNNQELCSFR